MNQHTQPALILVDDDPADRFLFQHALAKVAPDANLISIGSARELMEVLGAWEGRRSPVVLLDLNMPGLGGLDALVILRADGRLSRVPVVVLTGSGDATELSACYQAGASAVISKPVGLADLQTTVKCLAEYWLQRAVLPLLPHPVPA